MGDLRLEPLVQARHCKLTQVRNIDLVVLHDMEYPERINAAEQVAAMFHTTDRVASAHACVVPETRVLTADLRWVHAGELAVGDDLIGVDEFRRDRNGRTYQPSTVEKAARRLAPCRTLVLEDGRRVTSSVDHWWLAQLAGAKWEWVAADALRPGDYLNVPLTPWPSYRDDALAWLAGLLDGEGTLHRDAFEMSLSQVEGPVLERAVEVLADHGLPYRLFWRKPKKTHWQKVGIVSVSGIQANLELVGRTRPVRFLGRINELLAGRFLQSRTYNNRLAIKSVEEAGKREVVSLQTSSRTYFAEGIISHNCVDADTIVPCVQDGDVAYHAPGANSTGLGIEHAGYAAQRADEWADAFSSAELRLSAHLAAHWAERYRIPVEFLDAAALGRPRPRGFTTHHQVSLAYRKSTHTDPGESFPVGRYLEMVRAHTGVITPLPLPPVEDLMNEPVDGLACPQYGPLANWSLTKDGGVRAYKDAPFLGSVPALLEQNRANFAVAVEIVPGGNGGYRIRAATKNGGFSDYVFDQGVLDAIKAGRI